MKHVLSNSHSEKLPEKSRPRSIPSLIKRDIRIVNRTAEGQSDCKNYQWFRNIYSCNMVRCYQKLLYFLSFVSILMNFPDQILVAFLEVLIIQDHPWRSLEDTQHGRVYDFASKEGRSRTRVSFSCSAGRILFFMLSVCISRYAMDTCGKFGED